MNALPVSTAGRNEYLTILDDAWQAHLAPRAVNAPTVVSLFAGAGGSSLGYSMAGYRELLAVERDDHAVACFKLNFPDVPIFHGDIATLSVIDALEMAGIVPGELDVLDGSPPCQGFSTAGKRVLADPRNGLFREYVRLLQAFQPKAFVMENVSGMVKGKMKLVFAEIMRALKGCGYQVSARLMNAMYFHVPQSRERMILIGIREDIDIVPCHPSAIRRPFAADTAIAGAKINDCGQPKGFLADRMKSVPPGSNLSKVTGGNSYFSYVRCPIGSPVMTIQKSISFGGISIWHPFEERNCSLGELKRLSSFPDEFVFIGCYDSVVNRIGNSVPPLFMRAIAAHVARLLNASSTVA